MHQCINAITFNFVINACPYYLKEVYEYPPSQLAHDVVTTLDFGCILVATSDNVVTTLSQRFVSDVVTTTKN